MMEEWKSIDGFEGFYEVSNFGNVRSLNYHNWGIVKNLTPTIDRYGYERVCLCKNGKQFNRLVHRMVATAFIGNPDNLPQINHLNEIKTDNRAENLEWCSAKDNVNHGTRNERMSKSKRNTNCRAIVQSDLQGKEIRKWVSFMEVNRVLGYDVGFLARCCKGRCETAYGYKWRYAA